MQDFQIKFLKTSFSINFFHFFPCLLILTVNISDYLNHFFLITNQHLIHFFLFQPMSISLSISLLNFFCPNFFKKISHIEWLPPLKTNSFIFVSAKGISLLVWSFFRFLFLLYNVHCLLNNIYILKGMYLLIFS